MTNQEIFTLKIGGQAGQGIKSAGLMFGKVATRSGYNIYDYTEYPSLIRGGHNMMQISVSSLEITAPIKKIDLLIALNQETIDKYITELEDNAGIIYNETNNVDSAKESVNLFPVPLSKLVNSVGGKELLINTVAIGAAIALAGGNLSIFKDLISEEFSDKSEEIVRINHQAAEAGYNYVTEHFKDKIKLALVMLENTTPKMIINGNDAAAMGAIASGLQFAAIYPMTPTSNILHILAANQEKYGYIYKQPEDEIAAINMAIGASFAGARSMTATSGGGFCLMTEGYGLAGMTETPIVIIEGMRSGPATGLPTWNEQGDLQFLLHSHQGDFPRIILAAGDAKETFFLTMQAFNLADKYQTPVIVLVDKNICENDQSYPVFDTSSYEINRGKLKTENLPDYKRFAIESDGISVRTTPGTGNFLIANSDEHNEIGHSAEEAENRVKQMKKRMAKLETCMHLDMEAPEVFGPEKADLTLVSWGSNKGSILQAMKGFNNVNYVHITWMNPFPTDAVKSVLEKAQCLIDIECNYSGQLASLIKEKTGIEIFDKMLKFDGRPFFPEEIVEKIENVLKSDRKVVANV